MRQALRLQHCPNCGVAQYPRREVCGNCLSPELEWRETSGAGRLLSHTLLRVTLDPAFQDRLPLRLALIRLDAGPVLYAFAADGLETRGMAVEVEADEDNLFHARGR